MARLLPLEECAEVLSTAVDVLIGSCERMANVTKWVGICLYV